MPWVLLETTVALQGRVMSIQMYIEEVMWLILKMWTSRGKLSGQENTKNLVTLDSCVWKVIWKGDGHPSYIKAKGSPIQKNLRLREQRNIWPGITK